MNGMPRSLYLYVNRGIQTVIPAVGLSNRDLYLYVNRGVYEGVIPPVMSRSLFLYVNRGFYPDVLDAGLDRSLYLYVDRADGEVSPYLNHINPTEQYVLGQVGLFGDGFGQYIEAVLPVPAVTVSSVAGGSIAAYATDRLANEWKGSSGASNWIRFTWASPKRFVAVALEGATTDSWGVPRFKFDDATFQDVGPSVPAGVTTNRDAVHLVGVGRQMYWLPTPKVSTYIEIAIASGGSGTNRGFAEVWVIEEGVPPAAAETSRAVLNLGLPEEQTMGIVVWSNRSANWYPANSGVPPLPAATVTVPSGAVSGLVRVEETT